MWDDIGDAQMRANNTLVRVDGKPFYIQEVIVQSHDGKLYLAAVGRFTLTGHRSKVALRSPRFDWKPVPLGYMNYGLRAVFTSRMPCRKYKQGLSRDNLLTEPAIHPADALRSPQLARCVLRNYPTYIQAKRDIEAGENGPFSVAFHPDFALAKGRGGTLVLRYRGRDAGIFKDEETVQLLENRRYLKETIEELGHVHIG